MTTNSLTAEEIDYILSFMDKSTDYCENDDDYIFDQLCKEKLSRMKTNLVIKQGDNNK